MNLPDKDKLLKGILTILAIILVCTIASCTLFKSGETLEQYAINNPDIAFSTDK